MTSAERQAAYRQRTKLAPSECHLLAYIVQCWHEQLKGDDCAAIRKQLRSIEGKLLRHRRLDLPLCRRPRKGRFCLFVPLLPWAPP